MSPTRAPSDTPPPSAAPSPTPKPQIRVYVVKAGDTLSEIAAKAKVNMRLLQCMNELADPNLLQLGQELQIPPDGYACPPGWRRGSDATPKAEEPEATSSPAPTAEASVAP